MGIGLLFWIIMLVWLLFTGWSNWPLSRSNAPNFILFVLLLLLGWATFGPPIRGL